MQIPSKKLPGQTDRARAFGRGAQPRTSRKSIVREYQRKKNRANCEGTTFFHSWGVGSVLDPAVAWREEDHRHLLCHRQYQFQIQLLLFIHWSVWVFAFIAAKPFWTRTHSPEPSIPTGSHCCYVNKKKKSFLKFHRLVVILIGAKGDIRTTQVWTLAKVLWYYHTCKCVGINKRKGPTDTSISDESYIGQNNRKYFQRRYSTLNGDRNKKSTRKWNVSKNG